ncbi:hypothetical protein [Sulfurisoma sediminicola]|uniref:hypothetical protein n=1 Tax=Sulfurisoma sediminicola TaxID=1381557 RepID=UPI0011C3EE88|nr:hypothetical protein [Sulfurisoma sediminicola]
MTTAILFPVVFIAPLADEIVGKYQFERLCEEAKEVKIYGTIPVGEELYTHEGKWRSSDTGDNDFQLQEFRESLVLWDSGGPFPKEISAAIPIRMYQTKLYERKTKRLLAEWKQFNTPGGWLSQWIPGGQATFLTTGECMPEIVQQSKLQKILLPFKNARTNG